MNEFEEKLAELLDRHSMENGSDTPDFILAAYLTDCLKAFDAGVSRREEWYGRTIGEWRRPPSVPPEDPEKAELRQAIGLATTAVPDMVMDAEHPIDMMHKVVDETVRLRAEKAELEALLEKE